MILPLDSSSSSVAIHYGRLISSSPARDSQVPLRNTRHRLNSGGSMIWWQKFLDRLATLRGQPALDVLLTQARADQPLGERVAWAQDLLAWMRRDVPATRLKLFLQLLERQPEAHKKVAQTLRSIVRDTEALDLFADTLVCRAVPVLRANCCRGWFPACCPNHRTRAILQTSLTGCSRAIRWVTGWMGWILNSERRSLRCSITRKRRKRAVGIHCAPILSGRHGATGGSHLRGGDQAVTCVRA